ncbi:MAG: alpha/beta hydrolase fold domain-containing protein [Steroidobacteraceae bacterium]|nr:alpha/beta hydrolase fold domain-containing protein [Steroidobacteraceae bacterium]
MSEQRHRPGSGAILYLHGGAYCVGSHVTHRSVMSHLAHGTSASIFAADYRLAPEHPCPAADADRALQSAAGFLRQRRAA